MTEQIQPKFPNAVSKLDLTIQTYHSLAEINVIEGQKNGGKGLPMKGVYPLFQEWFKFKLRTAVY